MAEQGAKANCSERLRSRIPAVVGVAGRLHIEDCSQASTRKRSPAGKVRKLAPSVECFKNPFRLLAEIPKAGLLVFQSLWLYLSRQAKTAEWFAKYTDQLRRTRDSQF